MSVLRNIDILVDADIKQQLFGQLMSQAFSLKHKKLCFEISYI